MVVSGPFQENSFLIVDSDSRDAICIDPGDDSHAIIALINQHRCNPLGITNTHAHLDHIGSVRRLQRDFNIPFYLHQDERIVLETYPETCRLFGLPVGDTPTVDEWITDESTLTFGTINIQVLFTPGHTPGGTTFVIENHVFVGDTVFYGSVGRTDLPGGNRRTLVNSLVKMMNIIDPDYIVHSGHGPDTTIGREKKENPFLILLHESLNSKR